MQIDNLRDEHIQEVHNLEKECYNEQALSLHNLDKLIKNINANGFIIYNDKREVIAYLIYVYHAKDFVTQLVRIGVKKSYRRTGLGTKLINKIKDKIHANKPFVLCNVSDINLIGQLFLRNQGFVARKIINDNPNDVHYEFIFRYEWKTDVFKEDEVLGV